MAACCISRMNTHMHELRKLRRALSNSLLCIAMPCPRNESMVLALAQMKAPKAMDSERSFDICDCSSNPAWA